MKKIVFLLCIILYGCGTNQPPNNKDSERKDFHPQPYTFCDEPLLTVGVKVDTILARMNPVNMYYVDKDFIIIYKFPRLFGCETEAEITYWLTDSYVSWLTIEFPIGDSGQYRYLIRQSIYDKESTLHKEYGALSPEYSNDIVTVTMNESNISDVSSNGFMVTISLKKD